MDKTQLIYPTLNLFVYDLLHGLGSDENQVRQNRLDFWRKIDAELHRNYCQLRQSSRQKLTANLYLLQSDQNIINQLEQLAFENQSEQLAVKNIINQLGQLAGQENPNRDFTWFDPIMFESPLDGFLRPVQLRDTYGLLVNYSGLEKLDNSAQNYLADYSPQDYDQLDNLKTTILQKLAHGDDISQSENCYGTIGQSWLLWAQVSTDTDTKSVAEKCWKKLRPNDNWTAQPRYLGDWNGADIYEVLRFPQNWQQDWPDFQQSYHHLVLVLFRSSGSIQTHQELMKNHYETFLKLFCFHNKMMWSYWRHQGQVKNLHDQYGDLKDLMKNVQKQNPKTLKVMRDNLKKSLQFSSTYAIGLKDIQDQKHTITVNAYNHGKIWQEFELNSSPQIREWIEDTYLKQIEADYESLAPVLPMTENLMRSLEGMINLEQTESDRQLNMTIQVAGMGIAFASVTAAIASTQVKDPEPPALSPGQALGLSILIGVLVALGTAWFVRSERKK
ncbi:hypothetical protein PMG71_22900 [Roseofilum sp. BLCC_M154]|uniref:Uncharacterized protein n=1 Tax=Roseofilum acuticapitatum BLCC-M154 TaxID=3022444 RepID=A0ABT7B0E1_9CYAN|nr:hypothetical protein [Roseofilum acuticapitatum]MDJ1172282.1 hypothetical protein [Roseofilum acuticapitatum BLCC-M154]